MLASFYSVCRDSLYFTVANALLQEHNRHSRAQSNTYHPSPPVCSPKKDFIAIVHFALRNGPKILSSFWKQLYFYMTVIRIKICRKRALMQGYLRTGSGSFRTPNGVYRRSWRGRDPLGCTICTH